jgi:hypothetical protein
VDAPLDARAARADNRTRWLAHPHAAGPAGTLLSIHDQFHEAAGRLAFLLAREIGPDLGFVARAFRPLAQTLHHHHHAEETMLFPLIERQTTIAPAQLISDHEELTRAIDEVEASLAGTDKPRATAAVATFAAVLVTHLDREEELVIPVLLSMTPAEAWASFHG